MRPARSCTEALLLATLLVVGPTVAGANLITYLTASGDGHVMVMEESGGGATEVYGFGWGFAPSISPPLPEGTWVTIDDFDIYRVKADGTGLTKMLCREGTDIEGDPYSLVGSPQWSPDGSEILVLTHPEGHWYVGLVPATFAVGGDCASPLDLIYVGPGDGWGMEGTAAWNDDGSRIALFEFDQFGGVRLVILERGEAGWEPRVVPTDVEHSDWYLQDLDWQRGGSLLAFSTRLGTDPRGPVWLNWIDTASGDWGYLTEGGTPLQGRSPSWSPDGSQLIFTDRHDDLVKWTYLDGPTPEGYLEGSTELLLRGRLSFPDWQRDPLACTSDSECEDGNPCTDDSCVDSACVHQALTGSSCDDGNECTEDDQCMDGLCAGVAVLDVTSCDSGAGICCGGLCSTAACVSDGDCDDSDECTFDSCFNGNTCAAYCVNEPDPQCPVCLPKGEACTSGDECCSSQCHPVKGTCK